MELDDRDLEIPTHRNLLAPPEIPFPPGFDFVELTGQDIIHRLAAALDINEGNVVIRVDDQELMFVANNPIVRSLVKPEMYVGSRSASFTSIWLMYSTQLQTVTEAELEREVSAKDQQSRAPESGAMAFPEKKDRFMRQRPLADAQRASQSKTGVATEESFTETDDDT